MVTLPNFDTLPIEKLSLSFDNVTNSYKFFWFLAILEHIREKQSRVISINDLLSRMVAGVWYPTNYFRLSFGKQDRLGQLALQISANANLPADTKRQDVISALEGYLAKNLSISRETKSLSQYVPFRFLRPFFLQELRGIKDTEINSRIEKLAQLAFENDKSPCLYRFTSHSFTEIEIHPVWFEYINRNLYILNGFCLWHLVNYIQKNNPNVPNISSKLFEPLQRDLKQAKAFWTLVLEKTEKVSCIYSGVELRKGFFSLDHFLPWRFVAHDLLWNIAPTPKNVNSAKSDNLPNTNLYFNLFAEMQYKAVKIVAKSNKSNLLEDYTLLLKTSSLDEIKNLSFDKFHDALYSVIAPQIQIATNMGFNAQWSYAKQ